MKILLCSLSFIAGTLTSYAQIDSVSFFKSSIAEIKSLNVEEIIFNKTKINTVGEPTQLVTINGDCNYILPKYSQLTDGIFNFKKIKSDAQASLSALGSSLSVEKKSEFYVYYFTRSKAFFCPVNSNENKVSYGVGVYVIMKISNLKSKVDIRTPYDIAAVGQLGLARVEIDLKHFGMTPALANEFLPASLGKVDIEAAKYFDQLLDNTKNKITDKNTIPSIIPIEL